MERDLSDLLNEEQNGKQGCHSSTKRSLCLISALLCFTIAAPKYRRRARPALPPGPAALPVVGNLFLLAKLYLLGHLPHRALAHLAKVHGPVMTLKLGLTTTIVISLPDAAREALLTKDRQVADRCVPDAVEALGHPETSLVFQCCTQPWKQMRSICATHLFSTRSLEASRGIRRAKVAELVAHFREHAGRPVDFGRAVFQMGSSIIFNLLFSVEEEDLVSPETSEQFFDLLLRLTEEAGKPNVSDFFPALRFLDLQGRRRCTKFHLAKLFRILDGLIDRRLSSKASATTANNAGDFLDVLIGLYLESKLKRKAMRSLLADLLTAGIDTTWITLEWAMAELLSNPGTLAQAQEELREVIGSSGAVEESDVARLPYLQAVVKEVLRLHPVGPLMVPHIVAEDGVELGGYAAPKGTRVLVNLWAIGRDGRVWPEPETFMPERFLEREVDFKGRDFELIPFGSGRRSCPGMPMAARVLHLTLASLLHAFEWTLPGGAHASDLDKKEKLGATLAMAVPLSVLALPISSMYT